MLALKCTVKLHTLSLIAYKPHRIVGNNLRIFRQQFVDFSMNHGSEGDMEGILSQKSSKIY